jgi:hypothetical protein
MSRMAPSRHVIAVSASITLACQAVPRCVAISANRRASDVTSQSTDGEHVSLTQVSSPRRPTSARNPTGSRTALADRATATTVGRGRRQRRVASCARPRSPARRAASAGGHARDGEHDEDEGEERPRPSNEHSSRAESDDRGDEWERERAGEHRGRGAPEACTLHRADDVSATSGDRAVS